MHSMPVTGGHISVIVETIVKGFEDFSLSVPMPEWTLEKLLDAQGSFVTWPYAWVRFTTKVIIILYLISFYYFNCMLTLIKLYKFKLIA